MCGSCHGALLCTILQACFEPYCIQPALCSMAQSVIGLPSLTPCILNHREQVYFVVCCLHLAHDLQTKHVQPGLDVCSVVTYIHCVIVCCSTSLTAVSSREIPYIYFRSIFEHTNATFIQHFHCCDSTALLATTNCSALSPDLYSIHIC